ncbi:RHS repeat-associated core domain-containing protein [Streptomyces tamarix]|uniref:RHS repeat-associated core domain-containing protein n=1 Tax=Streptomyces tamarix TaxID=3078565 RepID=UPI003704BDFD
MPDQRVPAVGGGPTARPVRAQQLLQAGAVLFHERLQALDVPLAFLGAYRAQRDVQELPVRPVPRPGAARAHGKLSAAARTSFASSAQTFSKRYTGVFGQTRGTVTGGAWPDDKGFLGKTVDTTTGLTHVGARQYDPTIGQFTSADPKLILDQAQSLNGYAYANNNPVTYADPTGEGVPECMEPQKYGITCKGDIPVSSGGSGNGGGGGGCDVPCQRALDNIAKKWKGGLYKALGVDLKKYVQVITQETSPCVERRHGLLRRRGGL